METTIEKLNNLTIEHGKEYRKIMIGFASGFFVVWLNINQYLPSEIKFISLKYFLITAFIYLIGEIIQMIFLNVMNIVTTCNSIQNGKRLMIIILVSWGLILLPSIYFGWMSIFSLISGIK